MQADSGAEVVQIFDSWASHLSPQDFDVFAGPYIKQIIDSVRETHPTLPIILYISGSGGILERMAACKPDVISLDYTVDMVDGIKRIGKDFGVQVRHSGTVVHQPLLVSVDDLEVELFANIKILQKHIYSANCTVKVLSQLVCVVVFQGNLDPGMLFGSKEVIEKRIVDLVKQTKAEGVRHVVNLGHGVLVGTPEENVAHYFEVARTVHERL